MNDRLKNIRLTLDLSQEEFGNRLGIKSRGHISTLENGSRNITDRIISDVCREFSVNENWFRTGEGDMFVQLPRSAKLAKYFGEVLTGEDEFVKEVFSALSEMEPEFWIQAKKFAEALTRNTVHNSNENKNKE